MRLHITDKEILAAYKSLLSWHGDEMLRRSIRDRLMFAAFDRARWLLRCLDSEKKDRAKAAKRKKRA